jgi:CRISPR-associated protein Csx3
MKIVLCGPPHSGKSCLREGLKQAIRETPDAPYPYIITAVPDGEGAWFQETVRRSSEDARRLKDEYKRALDGYSPEFIKTKADDIKNCNLPITLIDIGGRPDEKNKEICRHATHAIILFNDSSKVNEWRQFCNELGLKIIAEIYSDYNGKEDSAKVKDRILKGIVHHLERGEDVSQRYCVTALANYILTNREKI